MCHKVQLYVTYQECENHLTLPDCARHQKWITKWLQNKSNLKLRANGRNTNSQHRWPENVESCCVRVGSGLLTDARTPNNT